MPTHYVSRETWGAMPPTKTKPMLHPVDNVVYTYNLAVDKCLSREQCIDNLQDMQRQYIREKGLTDIPYNFLIGDDGTVYEGRGWHAQPSLTLPYKEYTRKRVDIAFIGDYSDGDRFELMKPGLDLVQHGILKKYIKKEYMLTEHPEIDLYSDC